MNYFSDGFDYDGFERILIPGSQRGKLHFRLPPRSALLLNSMNANDPACFFCGGFNEEVVH